MAGLRRGRGAAGSASLKGLFARRIIGRALRLGPYEVAALFAATSFVRRRLGRDTGVVERVVLRKGQAVEIRDTAVTRKKFGARVQQ